MKKITIAGIMISLVLVVVGIVISIPRKVTGSYMLCSRTGEVKEVVFDFTINKGLLSKKGITGKIVFNGVEYVSQNDTFGKGLKVKEPIGPGWFVVPTKRPIDTTKRLYIAALGEDEEYIWLHEVDDNGQNSYFGPAQSLDEIVEIEEKILGK